jgi:hypothetical protein
MAEYASHPMFARIYARYWFARRFIRRKAAALVPKPSGRAAVPIAG